MRFTFGNYKRLGVSGGGPEDWRWSIGGREAKVGDEGKKRFDFPSNPNLPQLAKRSLT